MCVKYNLKKSMHARASLFKTFSTNVKKLELGVFEF